MGLRASGKTTVGRLLAAELRQPFIDLDDETLALIRSEHGAAAPASIADAFARLGEPAFRDAEARALSHALTIAGRVVALGGGSPTAPGAADLLRSARELGRARVYYLRADPQMLRARLAADPAADARPSITGRGLLAEIEDLHAARDPLYATLADAIIDARESPQACARAIIQSLK
jgi:shikimate kinase